MTVNLVEYKYLVALANKIFTADITFFNQNIQVLLVIDLGTRRVPGYLLQNSPISSKHVIDLLQSIKKQLPIEGIVIFHFDQQSIFKSEEFLEYAKQAKVNISHAEPHQHQNQCSEVLNKSIKSILRKKIANYLGSDLKPYLFKESLVKLVSKLTWEELKQLFDESVCDYNQRPHQGKRMFNSSPNIMEEALQNRPTQIVVPDTIWAPNDNSKEAHLIAQFKGQVLEAYAGNWELFFIDWRKEQLEQHNTLMNLNHDLKKQNEILKQQIDELVISNRQREERERQIQEAEDKKSMAREKRKNRKKEKIREYISYEEFNEVMELTNQIYKKDFIRYRVRVTLTLLYLTGLRISNLLLLTKKQIYDLLQVGEIEIKLIKNGKDRHLLHIGAKGRELLRNIDREIDEIAKDQPELGGPLFYSPVKPYEAINSTNFDKQCNRVLQKFSLKCGKYIRTHSFRATIITDLLSEIQSIEQVKDIMGHKAISSTDRYRRSVVGTKELRRIMGSVQRARVGGWKVKEIESKKENEI